MCGFCNIGKEVDPPTPFDENDFNRMSNDVWIGAINNQVLPEGIYLKTAKYLRIFKCSNAGTNSAFFSGFRNLLLKRFIVPSAINVAASAIQNSRIDYSIGTITAANLALINTRINSINDLTVTAGSALQNAVIGYCNNVTISGALSNQAFFGTDINILGTINCTTTNFQRMFQGCTTRELVFSAIPANPTNLTSSNGAFTLMPNLERMVLPNMEQGFSIANSAMSAAALLEMANSVGTANGSQTITTTGNVGAADTAYIAVLNGKGYTVIN
jgi:hypothetical protein